MRVTIVSIALVSTLAAAGVGGCAALSGLDQLQKVDCTEECDGGSDGAGDATVADAPPDAITIDATTDTNGEDASDSGSDTSADSAGDGADAPNDAPIDSPSDVRDAGHDGDAAIDAPADAQPDADAGCGATNTTTNCGACGNVCDTTTSSSRACDGTKCLYTCQTGHVDCNGQTAPNTDGCECATPGCCGTGCQTIHADGLGDPFYDCDALNTYDQAHAMEACTAFTHDAAQCNPNYTCTYNGDAGTAQMVCSDTSPVACACWTFAGTMNVGYVANTGSPGQANCACPINTNNRWH